MISAKASKTPMKKGGAVLIRWQIPSTSAERKWMLGGNYSYLRMSQMCGHLKYCKIARNRVRLF